MTLATRVSIFFLATLAIALAIYSLAFYSVTQRHINVQFEQELRGVLHSLVAAAEVEETEVKWQPLEHSISFGTLDEFGEVQWIVIGDRELIVERSRNADEALLARGMELAAAEISHGQTLDQTLGAEPQMLMYQRLTAPQPIAAPKELDEFDRVLLVVSRSTGKRDAILWRLKLLVILLPLAAWLVAAVLGGWIVRHALSPVSAMSHQARAIAGTDFQSRLQFKRSGDELSELGSAFNRLLDRQQAAFEQQRRFAGDAAHELRSPITVLMGQIDVALRRDRSESEYKATLGVLRQQTQTLQEIVEALLFLARSDGDGALPALQQINVHRWIDAQSQVWMKWPRAADLQIENSVDRYCEINGTAALMGRVVDNLVSNALKYSLPGTLVTIRTAQQSDQLLVQVADQGPGIATEELPHLFDPFFRSADARRKGIAGTGLGLAIASRIARSLGGSLTCESTIGSGSCFTLALPCTCKPH